MNRRATGIIALATILLAFAWATRHTTVKGSDNVFYLVNRWTGEITVVQGASSYPVEPGR